MCQGYYSWVQQEHEEQERQQEQREGEQEQQPLNLRTVQGTSKGGSYESTQAAVATAVPAAGG